MKNTKKEVKKFYKVFNNKEKHHNHQYVEGLNILKESFNDNSNETCCAGGFYFTDEYGIYNFASYGDHFREIILPTDNPNFRIVHMEDGGGEWRANMIILGKTKYYFKDPNAYNIIFGPVYNIFFLSIQYGCIPVMQSLLSSGLDIHIRNEYPLQLSIQCGDLEVIKFLERRGADIHYFNDVSLRHAAKSGFIDVVKYLVEKGANIHAYNDYAIKNSTKEVAEFLKSVSI